MMLLLLVLLPMLCRFVDGEKTFGVSRFDVSEWPFDQPFFLASTYNVGGQLADANVATVNSQMLIDYIRVYPANMAERPTTNVVVTAGDELSDMSGVSSNTPTKAVALGNATAAAPTGTVASGGANTPAAVVPTNTTVAAPAAILVSNTTAAAAGA
jgi:hypothetical protein